MRDTKDIQYRAMAASGRTKALLDVIKHCADQATIVEVVLRHGAIDDESMAHALVAAMGRTDTGDLAVRELMTYSKDKDAVLMHMVKISPFPAAAVEKLIVLASASGVGKALAAAIESNVDMVLIRSVLMPRCNQIAFDAAVLHAAKFYGVKTMRTILTHGRPSSEAQVAGRAHLLARCGDSQSDMLLGTALVDEILTGRVVKYAVSCLPRPDILKVFTAVVTSARKKYTDMTQELAEARAELEQLRGIKREPDDADAGSSIKRART